MPFGANVIPQNIVNCLSDIQRCYSNVTTVLNTEYQKQLPIAGKLFNEGVQAIQPYLTVDNAILSGALLGAALLLYMDYSSHSSKTESKPLHSREIVVKDTKTGPLSGSNQELVVATPKNAEEEIEEIVLSREPKKEVEELDLFVSLFALFYLQELIVLSELSRPRYMTFYSFPRVQYLY